MQQSDAEEHGHGDVVAPAGHGDFAANIEAYGFAHNLGEGFPGSSGNGALFGVGAGYDVLAAGSNNGVFDDLSDGRDKFPSSMRGVFCGCSNKKV